jgi:hypothetical protein
MLITALVIVIVVLAFSFYPFPTSVENIGGKYNAVVTHWANSNFPSTLLSALFIVLFLSMKGIYVQTTRASMQPSFCNMSLSTTWFSWQLI